MDCSIDPFIFTLLLQILIDILTIYTLLLKFYCEHHPRTISNFYLDIYKQIGCNIINFFINYGISYYIGEICNSFYFLLWSDLFLVTPVHLFLLYGIDKYAYHNKNKYLIQGVRYNEKLLSKPNIIQNIIFILSFIFCKSLIFITCIYPYQQAWKNLSYYTLDKMTKNANTKYILTFVIFSFLFNINRYWIIDSNVKGKTKPEIKQPIKYIEDNFDYAEL
jgi:hypothetical protein